MITFNPLESLSRYIRRNVIAGISGPDILGQPDETAIETIRLIDNTIINSTNTANNFLEIIFNTGKKFIGFIGNLIGKITISIFSITNWVINKIEQVKNFDWNATDSNLKAAIKNRNLQLASIWGGVLGQGVGWIGSIGLGYGIGLAVPVIGSGLLAQTLVQEVAIEALDELLPALRSAILQTINIAATNTLVTGYMNVRHWLQGMDEAKLKTVFGKKNGEFLKNQWGKEGGPNLSFNSFMDAQVDAIKDDWIQNFVEEALDESWDSFVEGGYIIAQSLHQAYSQNRLAAMAIAGPERNLDILPDEDAPDEVVNFVDNRQNEIIATTTNFIRNHRILQGRSIGEFVGQPLDDVMRSRPQMRKLVIEFNERPTPPWVLLDGKRSKRTHVAIPEPKAGLTWNEIKKAAKPYMWGPYRALAKMTNQRQLVVYGATENEAKIKLEELSELSTATISSLHISKEVDKPLKMKKIPTLMYPTYSRLMFRNAVPSENGQVIINGAFFDSDFIKFGLWPEEKPAAYQPLP